MKVSKTHTIKLSHVFNFTEEEVIQILTRECRKHLPPEMQRTSPEPAYDIYQGDVLNIELSFMFECDSSEPVETQPTTELLARPVDSLPLSVRASNCMLNANIKTIGELIELTENDVSRLKNMGKNTLRELKKTLASMGLEFAPHDDFHL